MLRWVHTFRTRETVTKKKPSGPARTVKTPENIAIVRAALIRSPSRSARRRAQELNLSRESQRKIVRKI
jgi:hypothetical protein